MHTVHIYSKIFQSGSVRLRLFFQFTYVQYCIRYYFSFFCLYMYILYQKSKSQPCVHFIAYNFIFCIFTVFLFDVIDKHDEGCNEEGIWDWGTGWGVRGQLSCLLSRSEPLIIQQEWRLRNSIHKKPAVDAQFVSLQDGEMRACIFLFFSTELK